MNRKKIVLLVLLLILTGVLVLAGCSPRQSEAPAPEEVASGEEIEEPDMEEPVVEEEAVLEDSDTPVSTEPEEEEAVEVPETEVPAAVVPEPEPMPDPEPEPEPEVPLSGTLVDGVREVRVVASQFDFGPEVITVRQGEEIRLLLTTDDVAHGIGLREFGINANIDPGETTVVTFVADASGEFTFFCSVPCGAGHGSMTGKLVVI